MLLAWLVLAFGPQVAAGQELAARAYAPNPVGARFLVANGQSRLFPELHAIGQLRLNDAMLLWCDRHAADAAVMPPELTRSAVHANNNEQARIILHMFNRGREGYANTRAGHADDTGTDTAAALQAWELPGDPNAGTTSTSRSFGSGDGSGRAFLLLTLLR